MFVVMLLCTSFHSCVHRRTASITRLYWFCSMTYMLGLQTCIIYCTIHDIKRHQPRRLGLACGYPYMLRFHIELCTRILPRTYTYRRKIWPTDKNRIMHTHTKAKCYIFVCKRYAQFVQAKIHSYSKIHKEYAGRFVVHIPANMPYLPSICVQARRCRRCGTTPVSRG